jgi:TatD DNase family protein
MFVDSHAHLDVPNYNTDRAKVIARAQAAGVELLLEIAGSDVGKGSLPKGLRLTEEYPFIFAAVGLHPHEASLYNEALEQELLSAAQHPKVIGWGEVGLDYHYDHSPREVQRQVFARQLELARQRQLPAIIHTREAEDDTIAILREAWAEQGGSAIGGIIHCFTSTQALADAALEMGFYISFSGVVTFKAAEELRAVARTVPLEKMLIETAKQLAELKGVSLEELARVTTENFKRLFNLPKS